MNKNNIAELYKPLSKEELEDMRKWLNKLPQTDHERLFAKYITRLIITHDLKARKLEECAEELINLQNGNVEVNI